ncbi:hypothetical protein IWX63_001891 [Arthrobacter sp. CAN_A2]|uniref:DUF1254 domain-containing protein n=1 Tax=Arthrobacter sp. CAN_A2 TaxID=2787718 RepID=UPI0018F01534
MAETSTAGPEASPAPPVGMLDWRDEYAYTAGVQAFIYGFAYIYNAKLRHDWATSTQDPAVIPAAAVNEFWHASRILDATYRAGGCPSTDSLYSLAWLDLRDGPLILSHPDMGERYFAFQLASFTSDNFGYAGQRTTGPGAGDFAVATRSVTTRPSCGWTTTGGADAVPAAGPAGRRAAAELAAVLIREPVVRPTQDVPAEAPGPRRLLAVPGNQPDGLSPPARDDEGNEMIWALLAFLGVPLWLCALGLFTVIYRNRALRRRRGNIPVRVLRSGKTRWVRGHAVWISDVFAWRGSPAAWTEGLVQVLTVSVAPADPEQRKHLRGLGGDPLIATMTVASAASDEPATLMVAVADVDRAAVLGPFHPAPDQKQSGR